MIVRPCKFSHVVGCQQWMDSGCYQTTIIINKGSEGYGYGYGSSSCDTGYASTVTMTETKTYTEVSNL